MQDFDFYNPTRIIFGENRMSDLKTLIAKDACVLILHGCRSAEYNGTLKEVRQALGGHQSYEFGGIAHNSGWGTVNQIIELIIHKKVTFLLAVGGGSVINVAKLITAAANYPGHKLSVLQKECSQITKLLSFGVVLTLPATGAEMNSVVEVPLTSAEVKIRLSSLELFPNFSILDPSKTYSLPARQLANGIVDAFVHIAEQYLTYPVDAKVQDRFAEGVMQTLIEIGPKIVHEPAEYKSRANMMWAASVATSGIIGAGVPQDWSSHEIGYEISALYKIDHARALAVLLPVILELYRDNKREKLLQYAERVWGVSEGNDISRIDRAILKTREFFQRLGMKAHLSDYALGKEVAVAVAKQLKVHGMVLLGEHKNITPEASQIILNNCLCEKSVRI